jgi:hypothetical protein
MSKNLDDLAQVAITNFIRKSVPLNDTIKELAERHELNAEEVKRVVGKANTGAMLHMLANSADKKQEFPLADYTLPTKSVPEVSTFDTEHLPDWQSDPDVDFDLRYPEQETEKTAAEYINLKGYFTSKIEKQQLDQTKVAAEQRIYDGVDYLVSEFSKYKAYDFHKFANEIYTVYGKIAEPLLNSIATGLDEDIVLSKYAGIVDDTHAYFGKFAEVMSFLKTLISVNERYALVNTNIKGFEHAYF